jgi:hypothetical protein
MAYSIRRTKEEFVSDGENLFTVTVARLLKDGFIDQQQHDDILKSYIIDCIDRDSTPDRVLNKLFPDNYSFTRRWMIYKV